MASDKDSWISSALGVDVGSIVSGAESAVSSVAETASNVAATAVNDVEQAASSAVDTATTVASSAAVQVESTVTAAAETVSTTASAVEAEAASGLKKAAATGAKVVSTVASAQAKAAAAAGSAVEDVASEAWQGAKVVGGAIEGEAQSKYQEMKDDAKLVKEGEGYADKGVDWLEDEAKSGTKWVADEAKGIPVVGQVAEGAEKAVDTYVDFEGGVLKGATGLVGGVVGAVADPVDTAKALYTMSEHIPVLGLPEKVLGEAYDVATSDKTLGQAGKELADPGDDAKYWKTVGKGLWDPISKSFAAGKPAEGIGQIGIQVASLFVGEGEVGVAGEVADVAGTAGKVADLGDAAELGKAADLAKAADAADAAKVADVSKGADVAKAGDASKAADAADAAADAKRVQVPVDPNVNPYAPTEPPPPPPPNPRAPTELPPDYLENPTFPPDPKVPKFSPEELGEQSPPAKIEPESPELPEPESDLEKPKEGAGESGSEPDGDQPPEDDYDVEAWNKYYKKHPEVKRSVGAAGENDPKLTKAASDTEDASAAGDADGAAEARELRSVDPQGDVFEDPAPPGYEHPSRRVTDHIQNRARGGHPTDPANLDTKTWEANSRKAGFEGNYTRDLRRYMDQGLTEEQARQVLQGEQDYILNDVHARPIDSQLIQELPDERLESVPDSEPED